MSVPWVLAEFRHNRIVQSPHENYFKVCRQHKEKRSREDVKLDNQLWGVKRTLSYFLLVANKKTIHSRTSKIVISYRQNSLRTSIIVTVC